ncbi:DUF262 domain-containing HNH endonuclease family protein [Halosquirtibacter laminarini]|uniref:DUF262 domain-containing HNH endonuclease family protein n=1 Tax=Halosquirtibacter laminarini TaxID=3374600 RepID=A0AC61NGE1_9BACT|nr:DUF262 domain-containing HNH endonuclease family protein [Prolixibacteraceae bacterium]
MNKQNFASLLEGKLFRIPDYQRGYAWEEKQLSDFVQDIDALVDEDIKSHYTGTIVTFQPPEKPTMQYGRTKTLNIVDVVDGQQRLTTSCLYLSVILKKLIDSGADEYNAEKINFLHNKRVTKLSLNNGSSDFFCDLVTKGYTNIEATSIHDERLKYAYAYFENHIEEQLKEKSGEYLDKLFDAITRKLSFTYYTIEEECEIGMTFELMNSRGKGLSTMELLKNYLLYWVSRNVLEDFDRTDLTSKINKSWKEIYTNLARCQGNEDQCLRIAWILYCSHIPKYWEGYEGFKSKWVIPIRDFSEKSLEETKEFIEMFIDGLSSVSKQYASILNIPSLEDTQESKWLRKIHNAGNIANFLPLIVSAKIGVDKKQIDDDQYVELLKNLELFSYRVFLWSGKRSNAGKSAFYRWAKELFHNEYSINDISSWVNGLIEWYSPHDIYLASVSIPFNWYSYRRLLKYTLFEYELWLLEKEGKNLKSKIQWRDLSDSTLEHILPQNPNIDSKWLQDWSNDDSQIYLHDISNIVLTFDNSHYSNFDFLRKKGSFGEGHCYANSDIRQERKISVYDNWDKESCENRRQQLVSWIKDRWNSQNLKMPVDVEMNEDDNED